MTTVNSDVRVRIWVAQIPQDGVYDVRPTATSTATSTRDWPSAATRRRTGCCSCSAGCSSPASPSSPSRCRGGRARGRKRNRCVVRSAWTSRGWPGPLPPPLTTYEPSDQGVRLEQLKTLAALRDSGALTEAEYDAEKRRILGG